MEALASTQKMMLCIRCQHRPIVRKKVELCMSCYITYRGKLNSLPPEEQRLYTVERFICECPYHRRKHTISSETEVRTLNRKTPKPEQNLHQMFTGTTGLPSVEPDEIPGIHGLETLQTFSTVNTHDEPVMDLLSSDETTEGGIGETLPRETYHQAAKRRVDEGTYRIRTSVLAVCLFKDPDNRRHPAVRLSYALVRRTLGMNNPPDVVYKTTIRAFELLRDHWKPSILPTTSSHIKNFFLFVQAIRRAYGDPQSFEDLMRLIIERNQAQDPINISELLAA